MANRIIDRGIDDDVLRTVNARLAHCFEILPLAFGQPPNSLIVATPNELNVEFRTNFRENSGRQIVQQGLTELKEFFEALNHFYPVAEAIDEYGKRLHPPICVDFGPVILPIDELFARVVKLAETYTIEIAVNELWGVITVNLGAERGIREMKRSVYMTDILTSRLVGMDVASKTFTIHRIDPQPGSLRLIPNGSRGG